MKPGNIVLSALIITTPLPWLSTEYKSLTSLSISQFFLYLGQLAGLTGATLFALNFILAARYKVSEDLLKGLNRVFITHHLLGKYAFYLLLLHPTLLSLQFISRSIKDVLLFYIPSFSNLPQLFGTIALTIVVILLILTLYVKLRYEVWKFTHQFMGLGLLFAFLHILLIPSTISYNLPLRYYLLSLFAFASYSYIYRVLLGPILIKRFPYIVTRVIPKGANIFEIQLIAETIAMKYLPGQFFFIEINQFGIPKEFHPFSFTSPPESKYLSFAAKSLGDFTETLKTLKPKSSVRLEGPHGRFLFTQAGPKQIWVAGGIGITPFLSLARSLDPNNPYQIDLYYSVTTQDEAVYAEELKEISAKVPNFTLFVHESQTKGRITAELISNSTKDFKSRDIFLCGPSPMMRSLRQQFKSLAIPDSRIYSEEFSLK